MNLHTKIKRLFLAGIIALALLLGTLGMTSKVQAGSSMQMAWGGNGPVPNGVCWRCN